jgi:hypothetical protein
MNDVFGDIISSYSRAQAIDDGVLVDLMQGELASLVREAGFKFPIAMTTAAFELAVWPIAEEDGSYDRLRGAANKWLESKCQDTNGRLWDVLWMLKLAARNGGEVVHYKLSVMNWQTKRRNNIVLKAVIGPGDDGAPVITIMLPNED